MPETATMVLLYTEKKIMLTMSFNKWKLKGNIQDNKRGEWLSRGKDILPNKTGVEGESPLIVTIKIFPGILGALTSRS